MSSEFPKRKRIAVAPAAEFRARPRLFRLLSELYPVDFEGWRPGQLAAGDAAIVWEGCAEEKEIAAQNFDCLVVARAGETLVRVENRAVNFGTPTLLDSYFRGQTLVDESLENFPKLQPHAGDEIVCAVDGKPYWLIRQTGRTATNLVALAPEEPAAGQTVYDLFNRVRWLRLLPFFHFLKRLTNDNKWEAPPVRACLMFDDPNLHWLTYGFINFREMAGHARELNYHVSFAMVPLDAAGWVHGGATRLFLENAGQLSLCIHGNNHAYLELGSPLTANNFTEMLAQGLRRIERFEKRAGVPVSRVMVPPYGAYREVVADPMLNLGYEAVCVSRASITHWNKEKKWPVTFGHNMAEFIGNGLPQIPRQVMAPGHEIAYRLAAFLNQPIIPHAHHQDCADSLELVASVANSINSLGKVVWSDMAGISRSNFLTQRTNNTLAVKMLSRRITLPVDADVKEIVVERPWISEGGAAEEMVCCAGEKLIFAKKSGRLSAALPLNHQGVVELFSPAPTAVDFRQIERPHLQMAVMTRRLGAEVRDRLWPFAARGRRQPAKNAPKVSGAAATVLKEYAK